MMVSIIDNLTINRWYFQEKWKGNNLVPPLAANRIVLTRIYKAWIENINTQISTRATLGR